MDYQKYVKKQLSRENWQRVQELNLNLDTRTLAEMWPDFVHFEKRVRKEVPFLLGYVSAYKNPRIFDACLGSGATTIGLKLAGFQDIFSNDIDENLQKVACKEAAKNNVSLILKSHDWRSLPRGYEDSFDIITCLGNSLTYLFKRNDQNKVLKNFRNILKPNGKLIIDERNYAEHFLKNRYKHSGDVVYCGKEKVSAEPIYVSHDMVIMEYRHNFERDKKTHLVLYPFKNNEMLKLLKKAGFKKIEIFGDYKKDFKPDEPEFLTYVCTKN